MDFGSFPTFFANVFLCNVNCANDGHYCPKNRSSWWCKQQQVSRVPLPKYHLTDVNVDKKDHFTAVHVSKDRPLKHYRLSLWSVHGSVANLLSGLWFVSTCRWRWSFRSWVPTGYWSNGEVGHGGATRWSRFQREVQKQFTSIRILLNTRIYIIYIYIHIHIYILHIVQHIHIQHGVHVKNILYNTYVCQHFWVTIACFCWTIDTEGQLIRTRSRSMETKSTYTSEMVFLGHTIDRISQKHSW